MTRAKAAAYGVMVISCVRKLPVSHPSRRTSAHAARNVTIVHENQRPRRRLDGRAGATLSPVTVSCTPRVSWTNVRNL
ncbi:hypothetical protein GCM10022248_65060 [Nonomuraea soli]